MSNDRDLSTPEKQKAFLDKLHADEDLAEERRYERDRAAAAPVTYLRPLLEYQLRRQSVRERTTARFTASAPGD